MKTCEEWSSEFDLLYNNISSDRAPGLEEYEKSVFLTRAQNAIVVALYKGSFGDAFESTEEVSNYLATLVKQKIYTPSSEIIIKDEDEDGIGSGSSEGEVIYKIAGKLSHIYPVPDDLLFRTYEECSISSDTCVRLHAQVVPVTQDEYTRTYRNPFKGAGKYRVLRLEYAIPDIEDGIFNSAKYSELIVDSVNTKINKYLVRYLKRPTPIILPGSFLNGETLSIDGYDYDNTPDEGMPCQLDEALHETILAEAVRMAKATWKA